MAMTELKIKVPEKFEEQLTTAAREMKIQKAKLIIDAVNRYIFIHEVRSKASKYRRRISRLGFKSEQDIFNAVS